MNFHQDLYREHLEEISLLYDQRLELIRSRSLPWNDFIHIEKRLESHLQALVAGGETALAVCEELSATGDVGERHGALRVMCRQNRQSVLDDFIGSADLNDTALARAIGDALCQDLPDAFGIDLIHNLLKTGPVHTRLASRIIAFRRIDAAGDLFQALDHYPDRHDVALDILHALGRLRPRQGSEVLLKFLHSTDEDLVNGAVTALVRIGEGRALKECMAFIGPGDWPKRSLGLYGDKHALSDSFFTVSNLDEDARPAVTQDYVMTAGLIGNIAAVPELIHCLDVPDLSETAALFLNLMTGAELYEEIRVPVPVDVDELFDDERERWENGCFYPSGSEPGTQVRRLSRNPADWTRWWESTKHRFDPAVRYRTGKPVSPGGILDTLKSPGSPDLIRRLAYDELVIRYGIDIPFETTMTVVQQLRAIETYMIRLKDNPDGFVPGLWYYNRKPMTRGLIDMAV